jgi:SAM-dependent methyltransferase
VTKRLFRIARNVYFDVRCQGRFLGGTVTSTHADEGAKDVHNSDYGQIARLFMQPAILPHWHPGYRSSSASDPVIVDVGCGRGRVINWLLCNGYCGEIVGIEIEERVAAETARRLRRRKNVSIRVGDACELLPENATLLYMFNPFNRQVMTRFCRRIESTYSRPLTIVYNNAAYIDGIPASDSRWSIEPESV